MGNTTRKFRRRKSSTDSDASDSSSTADGTSYTAIGRRKSVFAEAYNPEDEDEMDEKIVSLQHLVLIFSDLHRKVKISSQHNELKLICFNLIM